jgi:hypothetical protein
VVVRCPRLERMKRVLTRRGLSLKLQSTPHKRTVCVADWRPDDVQIAEHDKVHPSAE